MGEKRPYRVCKCGNTCRSLSGLCRKCSVETTRKALGINEEIKVKLEEAAAHDSPALPRPPKLFGDWGIISDVHVPAHDVDGLLYFVECAQLLGIKQLLIAGDLLDNKAMAGFARYRSQPNVIESIIATRNVLDALLLAFDRIVIFPGNHEQWTETRMARQAQSIEGRLALEQLAALLGKGSIEDIGDLATSFFAHFFSSDKVEFHHLPEATINETWDVLHPGNYSRVPPQTERRMSHARRKCVVGGHSHLWGVSFDDSGTDAICNLGHLTTDNHRYRKAKPTTHPAWVRGFAFILTSDENPKGELLPIAVHDRYFNLPRLARRLAKL